MEKYFKPVHSPSDPDKSKLQKHQNQQHPHHQEPRSDRYITCDYTDRNTDESYGHRYDQHGHYYHNICSDVHLCHQTKPFPQCEEDDIVHDHTSTHVTLSRASSSSSLTSSSSSTSSTSWYTEASASDIFSHSHAERPQHSLSCSNIHDVRRFYQLDDSSDPIVFATIKHGSNGSICNDVHRASEKGKQVFAPLDCGHSRSNDGFLQGDERKIAKSHLNRSLCFSEEDIMLGVTKGPKRAVSSSQLPSKGILKNKEPHSDIRKAKSMEVLSPRVAKEQSLVAQKAKGPAQVDIEQARENFVQEKLKFSAFLDEITKQVISPSDLKILGLNANNTAGLAPLGETPDPPKPQLPPKKHRESSVEGNEQKHQSKHVKAATSSTRKHSDPAKSDRLSSYVAMHHHGSPPPHSIHHKSTRKDRRPPSTEASGYGRSGSHLTDGTSTSPELIQPRQRHKLQPTSQSPLSHVLHRGTANSLPSSSHGSGAGLGSESSSSKSDSSRTRETVSTATSSEQSGHYHSQHTTLSGQHRGTQCEADHLQALQEENADLHQNLLQTVVCIENLEAELQRTRDELIHVKEKYKSLLESHSGAQQANHLLQDHLHAGAETLNNERQCMFTRVAQLTSELEDAHRTIKALENINVPNLIKESLEKHLFASAGTKEQFMSATTQFSQLASSPKTDNHSYTPKVEGASHDWLSKLEGGPQRPTAFTPFKHGLLTTENQSCISGSLSHCSPSFSSADASTAFYKKFMSGFATGPQPICVQPLLGTTTTDMLLPNVQQTLVGGDNCAGKGEVKLVLSEQANVTAMSAQQILNDFMQQLRAQKEPDRDTTQQGEWGAGATEQIGKAGE